MEVLGKCNASTTDKDDNGVREDEEYALQCCCGDDVTAAVLQISGRNIMSQRMGCFDSSDIGVSASLADDELSSKDVTDGFFFMLSPALWLSLQDV